MDQVTRTAQDRVSPSDAHASSPVVQQANHIRLVLAVPLPRLSATLTQSPAQLVLNAVARHRKDTSATVYGLSSSVLPLEAWTSRATSLKPLQWHFDATDALVRTRARDGADAEPLRADLKKQMASLADFVFTALEERLLFLRS